ncbi:MAG: hypothetical protein KGY57_02935 [Gammaproteobacteria bacterium]|nr:hypothetical protein [Gammaproteobacteria bacterium]
MRPLPHKLLALGLLVVALTGCYESVSDVTIYEPGVYKGSDDPLLNQTGSAESAEALRQRFSGQRDR